MAKPAKKSGAKKTKRNVPNGVAHIQSTFNNTIVSITDTAGEVISWSSAGASGFKGARKGTPFAAQTAAEAAAHAEQVLRGSREHHRGAADADRHAAIGTGFKAALSSFLFFAVGALVPVLPYLFGLSGTTAEVVAALLVGLVLLVTGIIVGLLSGAPPLRRALRQLAIGYGAAAVTYLLGLLVGGLG